MTKPDIRAHLDTADPAELQAAYVGLLHWLYHDGPHMERDGALWQLIDGTLRQKEATAKVHESQLRENDV